jgi:hypothetical protein
MEGVDTNGVGGISVRRFAYDSEDTGVSAVHRAGERILEEEEEKEEEGSSI